MPGINFLRQKQNTHAIREYLSAIKALLTPSDVASKRFVHDTAAIDSNNVTVDVCLISCILFTCFEILSGHYGPAINHVQSGMKILSEVSYDPGSGTFRHPHLQPSTVTTLEMENTRKILLRLQGQSITLTRTEMDGSTQKDNAISVTPHISVEIPGSFASIADARDSFESLNRACVHHYPSVMRSVPAAEASDMSIYLLEQYGTIFHKWCTALAHFEQSRGQLLTTKERIGLKLLTIYKLNTAMYYDYTKSSEAALFNGAAESFSWDRHNSRFEEIVDLAASVIRDSDGKGSSVFDPTQDASPSRPLFSLDNGVIGPLYNVATLCRHPIIRRKAVHVLRSTWRQEGVLNSYLCAFVAEKVIEMEEAAAAVADVVDYQKVALSMESTGLDKLDKPVVGVTNYPDIPDTARLTYAYPKFDIVKKQVFLTIGQSMKMHIDIPLPAMDFLIDVEN